MDDKRIMDYSSAMERIQAVTGCGTQRELGRFLGINQSAISDAKRRGTIPAEWLLTLLRGKGIKRQFIVDYSMLEFCIREHLNAGAPRAMAVLDPIKVVIEGYPEGQVEELRDAPTPSGRPRLQQPGIPFSRQALCISSATISLQDRPEIPPPFSRREVRLLRYTYFITCRGGVAGARRAV